MSSSVHSPRNLLSLLLVALLTGCSTATAAGCATGVLSGVTLAVASTAAAPDGAEVDTGAAALGGALFGLACGCTGAGVAEAMVEREDRREERRPTNYGELADLRRPRVAPRARAAGTPASKSEALISGTANVGDMHVRWVGRPGQGLDTVAVRFVAYGPRSGISGCPKATVGLDDERLTFPLEYKADKQGPVVRHRAQLLTDLATIRRMQAAQAVTFDVCGAEGRLNTPALDALNRFVDQFEAHSTTPTEAVAEQAPASDAPLTAEPVKPTAPVEGKAPLAEESAKQASAPQAP